jgi:hypothetical protein
MDVIRTGTAEPTWRSGYGLRENGVRFLERESIFRRVLTGSGAYATGTRG